MFRLYVTIRNVVAVMAVGLLLQGCGKISSSSSADSSSMPAQISTDAQ